MDSCKLCGGDKPSCLVDEENESLLVVQCPRCGKYNITNGAFSAEPDPFIKERLYLISAVARRSSERGNFLQIKRELLVDRSEFEARILSVCPRNTQEKMDAILAYVAEKSSYPGRDVNISLELDYPLFYCNGKKELKFYLGHLEYLALIGQRALSGLVTYPPTAITLSGEGWRRVEEHTKPNIESKQAFVAMWFNDEVKTAYSEGIAKLEEDTGFSMLRIDMSEFNDKICDKILAEIRKSRFVIADVTGHRQGVYFEAGFAMGLGLPVIWTCREDQKDKCHFDTRQYNHIFWTEANELREKLRNRIIATVGMAPK